MVRERQRSLKRIGWLGFWWVECLCRIWKSLSLLPTYLPLRTLCEHGTPGLFHHNHCVEDDSSVSHIAEHSQEACRSGDFFQENITINNILTCLRARGVF